RTVPVVLDLCRVIEQYAADCTLLTFSNPSSVVQRAVMQKTTLKVVGLCDAPATMHRLVARALGQLPDHVDTQYVGMHHFGWITSALVDGVERVEEALSDSAIWAALGIDPAIGGLIGALPHPYFRYFFHPHRMLAKQRSAAQPRALDLQRLEAQLLAEYAEYAGRGRPESLSRRSAVWYEAVVAPVVAALAFGVPARLALNLRNDGRVDELADDTVIEISARIEGGVIEAPRPRRLPSSVQLGLLQANAAYERALVEAILDDSRERLLEALLIHPLVPSFDAAREIVDELWPRRGWPKETAS
ncbi:MAG: hypothetical protein IT323_18885, partial [Anaerolineae bacterium]|nr:hypothetical protein [Anaerolineae bacterium]